MGESPISRRDKSSSYLRSVKHIATDLTPGVTANEATHQADEM